LGSFQRSPDPLAGGGAYLPLGPSGLAISAQRSRRIGTFVFDADLWTEQVQLYIAVGSYDALCPLKSCQLLHNCTSKCSAVAEMGDRSATVDISRKEGGCCAPFGRGELGPHLTMLPVPRPSSVPSGILIHPAVWPQQTSAANWGLKPLGNWVPIQHNVAGAEAYLCAKFHFDPRNRLAAIHQRCRQTDRIGREDNGPIA